MIEQLSVKGEVHVQIFKNGVLIEDSHINNLVVNVGKQSLAALIGGASGYANKRVSKVGFGTSGAPTAGANTALENAVIKALDGVTLSGTAVTFEYALEANQGNGLTIREFGLYSIDDTLFSRITRNPIVKTADIRIAGTWKITF
jgi:hypothetical protein